MDLFQGHVISEKVDIWALGVILFKLAFFHTPFEDNKGNVDAGAILKGLGDRKVGGCASGGSGCVGECLLWFFLVCVSSGSTLCVFWGGGRGAKFG